MTGPVFEGRPATFEEQFLVEWGRETWKKSIENLNAGLQRLVTLATALLGGSLAFPKDDVIPPNFRWAASGFFLFALGVALWYSLPGAKAVDLSDPDAVAAYKDRLYAERWTALVAASTGVFVGLALALLGAVVNAARPGG